MDIQYLGHSSFRMRSRQGILVTDPFDPDKTGLPFAKTTADVVTISHEHDDHNYREGVKAKADKLIEISGPGEYEVQEISVFGWQSFHDDTKGADRGKNIVFKIEMDDVKVVHLGDLGHMLSEELIEEIGEVDVLLIPTGGVYTINSKQAVSVVKKIEPRIVIPMHYKRKELKPEAFGELEERDLFVKELGLDPTIEKDKLTVTVGMMGEDLKLVVME